MSSYEDYKLAFVGGEYYYIVGYTCLDCSGPVRDAKSSCLNCGGRYLDPIYKPVPNDCRGGL